MVTNLPDMFRMSARIEMGQTAVGILAFTPVGLPVLMFFGICRDRRLRPPNGAGAADAKLERKK